MKTGQSRLSKQKLKLVDNALIRTLTFNESLGKNKSVYRTSLVDAIQSDKSVCILSDDKYMLQQFKTAAKKLQFRLVFALDGNGNLYIKPLRLEGELKRLYLWLRNPQTFLELQGKKLELDLKTTLEEQISKGFVRKEGSDKYKLTEKGLSTLVE